MSRWRLHLACAIFAAACALAGLTALAPGGYRGAMYIAAHLLASAAMLGAYRYADARAVGVLLLVGVACRLALVPVPPYTTHDVTRYMFDGAMAAAGLDPYTVAPDDPRAAALHALWPSAIEHAGYPTLYPPLAVWAFSSCARFGPGAAWLVWKALVAAASVVALLVARAVVSPKGLALLALSPLLVLEGGIGAHLDVLCVMAVMLAVVETTPLARGAWIGVGVLLKLTPITLLAPLVVHAIAAPWRGLRLAASAVGIMVLGYGVASAMGYEAMGSLVTFFTKWSFGSPWMLVDERVPRTLVLRIGALVGIGAILASCWLAYQRRLGAALLLAACAPYLASPVVFPWYLCTAAALLALTPSALVTAWSIGLPLTYEVIDRFDVDGTWHPASWPIIATLAAVALAAVWRRRWQ